MQNIKISWKSNFPGKSFPVEYFQRLVKISTLISPDRLPTPGLEIHSARNCKCESCELTPEYPSTWTRKPEGSKPRTKSRKACKDFFIDRWIAIKPPTPLRFLNLSTYRSWSITKLLITSALRSDPQEVVSNRMWLQSINFAGNHQEFASNSYQDNCIIWSNDQ